MTEQNQPREYTRRDLIIRGGLTAVGGFLGGSLIFSSRIEPRYQEGIKQGIAELTQDLKAEPRKALTIAWEGERDQLFRDHNYQKGQEMSPELSRDINDLLTKYGKLIKGESQ